MVLVFKVCIYQRSLGYQQKLPLSRVAAEGIKLAKGSLDEHHQHVSRILEAARQQAGIESFNRDDAIYAELTPRGMMTSRNLGNVIEIAVDPAHCLVCNAELYSEASSAYLRYEMGYGSLGDVRDIAKMYWENAVPLTQFDISSLGENEEKTLEVLIGVEIPREHIRIHPGKD